MTARGATGVGAWGTPRVGAPVDKGSGAPMGGSSLLESVSKNSRSATTEGVGS
jgi:hypothetical protein